MDYLESSPRFHTRTGYKPCGSASSWANGSAWPSVSWATRRRTRSRAGIGSTSSALIYPPATCAGRDAPKRRRYWPSCTTWRTALRCCDDQGRGLSLKGIAACMGPGVAIGVAHACRWSLAGAEARNETVCRHRLAPATSKCEGGSSRARRVSAIVFQVEESRARPRRTRIYEAPARRPDSPDRSELEQ